MITDPVDASSKVKHYHLRTAWVPGPALLFEVKLELQDVRSGYRDSARDHLLAPWLEEKELNWTREMVLRIDPASLKEIDPSSQLRWPRFGDEKIIQYLVQYYGCPIWKNYALGLYSQPGESREEFVARCKKVILREGADELRRSRDMFVRRFFELEQKLIARLQDEEWEEHWKNRKLARVQETFSQVREDLNKWSVREASETLPPLDFNWQDQDPEVQDRLDDLRQDLISSYNEISEQCEYKVNQIEPYEVPVNYSQIEIVSRGIVWTDHLVSKTDRA